MDVTRSVALPFSLISRLDGTERQRVLKVMALAFFVFKESLFAVYQKSASCNSLFAFSNS